MALHRAETPKPDEDDEPEVYNQFEVVPAPKEIRLLATIGVVAAAGGATFVLGVQALQGDANATGQIATLATLGMGALIGVMAARK